MPAIESKRPDDAALTNGVGGADSGAHMQQQQPSRSIAAAQHNGNGMSEAETDLLGMDATLTIIIIFCIHFNEK